MDEGDDELARRIGFATWAVRDALQAAAVIAGRAAEHFSGMPAALIFHEVRSEIARLDDSDAMKAARNAAIPPSMMGKGKPK